MADLLKMTMSVEFQPQVEIDPELSGKFMQQIPIWEYCLISRDSYIAFPNAEREKLICIYYNDMKSRGSGRFDIILFYFSGSKHA